VLLDDVQSSRDDRNITLDQVGISDLLYPIVILDRDREKQDTVASISMSVELPHHFRGTHMSRFLEVLHRHSRPFDGRTIPAILSELKKSLDAESAGITLSFPFFMRKQAPVSGAWSVMDYRCCFRGTSSPEGEDFVLSVSVPVSSTCPCSREISSYGAHNQRSRIDMEVRTRAGEDGIPEMVWIEELVALAEESASSPVYSLLKRPDERFVTESSYDNPVFVEDMVRNAAELLMQDSRIVWFRVTARSQESIHNHTAFAGLQWERDLSRD
jgi:GTP cyclohydrolase IB